VKLSAKATFLNFTASLRWYRLAFASTLLPPASEWRHAGQVFRSSVEWASQILFHLSASASTSMNPLDVTANTSEGVSFEPNPSIVEIMSFAIDHYYVVM